MGKQGTIALLTFTLTLTGCATLERTWQRVTGDPVGSALVVIGDQYEAARQTFYLQDADAIDACEASGGTDCQRARCMAPACVAFRKQDPTIVLAYNVALQLYQRAASQPTLVLQLQQLGAEIVPLLRALAALDPDRAQIYLTAAATIAQAVAEVEAK